MEKPKTLHNTENEGEREALTNTHVGDHGEILALGDGALDVAGVFWPEDSGDALTQHVHHVFAAQVLLSLGVLHLQHAMHFRHGRWTRVHINKYGGVPTCNTRDFGRQYSRSMVGYTILFKYWIFEY